MRRFIAGAVCPRCRALDRLVLESDPGSSAVLKRVCVACGFAEEIEDDSSTLQSKAGIPRGRVEGGRLQPRDVQPSVVRIVSPESDPSADK